MEQIKKNFGFGCMRLPIKNGEVDAAEMNRMVDLFLEKGFNYFDTAHGYLGGKSETALRECLVKRYPRERYILTDKLTNFYFDSQEEVRPFFESQLSACGVDYFDFYLMHAQSEENFAKFKRCRAYETALELKAEGKIRHFGISFHDKAEALEQILQEYPQIEVVQIQFNYLDYHDAAVQSEACYDLEQMKDNLSFMEDFSPLSETELAAVKQVRTILHGKNMIPCTACRYCTDGCPKRISIPDLFACMNAKKTFHDWNADYYYNNVHTVNNGKASDCVKCGKCEKACLQHLEIRRLLAEVAEEFEKR